MRVVHYLNQFFGGIGGEEVADAEPQIRDGAIGPGRLLEQVLEDGSRVVRTVICGDNYAAENLADLTALILKETSDAGAELFVAGPCFEAGRYGVASGALCAAVSAELGIPVVTAMAVENPGVDLHRQTLYIMDSGKNASAMREVLGKMAGGPGREAGQGHGNRPSGRSRLHTQGHPQRRICGEDGRGTAGGDASRQGNWRALRV